jgi:glycosylphosphatidylinositol transamidase (GPIT) subunit GPI8
MWDQEFDPAHEDAELKPIQGNKAVLVAASSGWENYRHQADVLAYYQLLKSKGFTDDDIVLIAADDLAYHVNNPSPGMIINDDYDRTDLYVDVKVDYKLDQITPKDFVDIMLGK